MRYKTRGAAERFIAHKTRTTSVLNGLKNSLIFNNHCVQYRWDIELQVAVRLRRLFPHQAERSIIVYLTLENDD